MLCVYLITTLLEVRRGRLGRERIQAHVIEFLRIYRERDCGRLLRGCSDIRLRIRIEAFQLGVSFERRETIYRCPDEPVFE